MPRSPCSLSFPPSLLFPLLFRGGDKGGLEATAVQLRSTLGTQSGGTSGGCEPWSAAQSDRTPPPPLCSTPQNSRPLLPAQTLPFSAVPRFKANPDGKGVAGGAWWRRKGSFCSKSQEEEIHFLNTLPVAAPFFFSLSTHTPPAFFFFSANALNERVASSTQNPFDVLAHIYIYLRVRGVSKLTQEGQLYSKPTCKCCKVS